jgi:putative serine protease PepD
VLKRVVVGFLSEDRIVRHPAIGIFCRDAVPQGALIDSVTKGSPADKAGLMKNDIIKSMNNQAVRDQIDFAKIMSAQEVGDILKVWVQRGGLQQLITVEVGTQP